MGNGEFSGNPRTLWLSERGDDRDMQLLQDFWYIDPQGRRWLDGALVNQDNEILEHDAYHVFLPVVADHLESNRTDLFDTEEEARAFLREEYGISAGLVYA